MRRLSAFDEKFSRSAGVPGARDRSGKRWKSSEYGFLRESLTESREAIRRSRSRSDRPESSRDRGRLRIADNRNGSYNSTFSVGNSLNPDLPQAARRFGCGASNFSIHSSGTIFAGAWLLGTPRRYHTRSPPRHPERRLVAKLVALSPRAIRRFFFPLPPPVVTQRSGGSSSGYRLFQRTVTHSSALRNGVPPKNERRLCSSLFIQQPKAKAFRCCTDGKNRGIALHIASLCSRTVVFPHLPEVHPLATRLRFSDSRRKIVLGTIKVYTTYL